MDIMDFDSEDSDYDSETELQNIEQLNAVLDFDDPSYSVSTSRCASPTGSESGTSNWSQKATNIDRALDLNNQYDEKLRKLESILNERLYECDMKLAALALNNKSTKCGDRQETFRYVNCGKPYFRDRANFTPPNNEDTVTMVRTGMYDFSAVSSVPGWTVKDKSQFLNILLKTSREIRKKELESKISALKREAKTNPSERIERNIGLLSKELENNKKKMLKDIALPINEEYDWELLENKLNRRHSANEYQTLWKLFLHPSINKSNWTKSEHTALQDIAQTNRFQNWDEIALKLGTKRTGYQCFVYFRTNMSNTFTGKKWTKEEEEYLKRLIDYYREDKYIPWGKVATSMENRTKIQIYNKYSRLNEHRKGRFLAEEDAVILTCADHFGPNFKRMTSYIPGRSSAQLRLRYQILAKKRISTVWTADEDNKLLKLLANEDSPSVFSSLTKHFPGKDRMHMRSRYVTLMKWMRAHPNADISKAPRRAARRLGHGQALDNLNKAIENLKKRIQSEVEVRKCKKVTRHSPDNVVDDAIMATLLNQIIKEEENKKLQQWGLDKFSLDDNTSVLTQSLNVTNLRRVLLLLKSKLKKEPLSRSMYCQVYPDLLQGEKDISLVNRKSYSKMNSLKTVIHHNPDIFGGNTLEDLEYVLPPHYATITGCRQLMALIPDQREIVQSDINVNVLLRKNNLLKRHFYNLMERFNTMFLWPMLLSNDSPEFEIDSVKYDNLGRSPPDINDPFLDTGMEELPEMKTDLINENIDLEESENDKEEINLMDILENIGKVDDLK